MKLLRWDTAKLLWQAAARAVRLRTRSSRKLIIGHRFFALSRRADFKLPENGAPVFFIFGAAGATLDRISTFFRGAATVYVRPTRRGTYTTETIRIILRVGVQAVPVFATQSAYAIVRRAQPQLAQSGRLATLSPLELVTKSRGIDALWLRPVVSAPEPAGADQPETAFGKLFERPWSRPSSRSAASSPSAVVFAGSSYAGPESRELDRQTLARVKTALLSGGPDASASPSVSFLVSPLALDAPERSPQDPATVSFGSLWEDQGLIQRVYVSDEALAVGLSLAGFDVQALPLAGELTAALADSPIWQMDRPAALALLTKSVAETRFVLRHSKRGLSARDVASRLGLADDPKPASQGQMSAGLLELGLIDVAASLLLAQEGASGQWSAAGCDILRGVLRREARAAAPLLGRRVDLLDDFLDFVSSQLGPEDQPAAVLLRWKMNREDAEAVTDLANFIAAQGATEENLSLAAREFAGNFSVLLRLARRFAANGSNRSALSLVESAAASGGAPAALLAFAVELQLDLGLSLEALATARRLAAQNPDDPAALTLMVDARAQNKEPAQEPESGDSAASLIARAELAHFSGDLRSAERLARQAAAMASSRLASIADDDLTNFLLAQDRAGDALEVVTRRVSQLVSRTRDGAALMLSEVQTLAGFSGAALETLRAAERSGSSIAASRIRALLVRSGRLDAEIAAYSAGYQKSKSLPRLQHLLQMLALGGRIGEVMALAAEARQEKFAQPIDIAFVEGTILNQHGRWTEALAMAAPYLSAETGGARIAMIAGRARTALGDLEGARAAWRLALATTSTEQAAHLALARLAERSRDYGDAAGHYADALGRSPLSKAIAMPWAACVRLNRELARARQALSQRADDSLDASVAFQLSILEAEDGRLDESIRWAARSIAIEPLNINLARHAIENYVLDADYEKARAIIDTLAERSRTRGPRLAEVADLYRGLGQMDEAAAQASHAVTLAPRNPAVLYIAARIRFEREEFDEAWRLTQASLDIDPARMGSYALGTRLARRLDRAGEADALSAAAERIWPDRSLALTPGIEFAVTGRDAAEAVSRMERLSAAMQSQEDKPQVRLIWSVAALAGEARQTAQFLKWAGEMVAAIHAVFPPDLGIWDGAPFAGNHMLVIARGGPGDEARFYFSVMRGVFAQARHVTQIGDPRLESIFRRNFPGADFVANPWAGRRLGRKRALITDEMRRSLSPGTLEALRRFGAYLPQAAVSAAQHIAVADALLLHRLYPHFGAAPPAAAGLPPLSADPAKLAEAQRFLDSLPPGPRIGISWRASYVSANRFSGGFFDVEEMAGILAVPNAVFIDLHPNVIDAEFARAAELAGGRFARGGFDLQDDFEALAALCVLLDGVIVPGVTQRDIAGSFRDKDIWSFNLAPEYSERWRVAAGGRDHFQPAIIHHDTTVYGSRAGVAEALRARVAALAEAPRTP